MTTDELDMLAVKAADSTNKSKIAGLLHASGYTSVHALALSSYWRKDIVLAEVAKLCHVSIAANPNPPQYQQFIGGILEGYGTSMQNLTQMLAQAAEVENPVTYLQTAANMAGAKGLEWLQKKLEAAAQKEMESETKLADQGLAPTGECDSHSPHPGGLKCTLPKGHSGDHKAEASNCQLDKWSKTPTMEDGGDLGGEAKPPPPDPEVLDMIKLLMEKLQPSFDKLVELIKAGDAACMDRIGDVHSLLVNEINDLRKHQGQAELVVKTDTGEMVGRVKGKRHKQFEDILRMLKSRNASGFPEFMLITGAPGAGKTYLTKQLGEALNLPFQFFSCGPTTTEGKILGFNNIANGTFIAGWIYKMFGSGGVLALDEIFLADASVLGALNACENEEYTFGNGERVKRHPDFYLIAYDNTNGTGATKGYKRNAADAATLDRFTEFELVYDEDLEREIYGNAEWANYVIKVRDFVKKSMNDSVFITPRATRKGAAYLANGIAPEVVVRSVLFRRVSKDVQQTILANCGTFPPAVKPKADPFNQPASSVPKPKPFIPKYKGAKVEGMP